MSLQQVQHQQQQPLPLHICITGSSQGIGHIVYHANRNIERSQVAVQKSGGGIPMVCDLSDFESIQQFSKELHTVAPRLDVLCLNAGIAPSTNKENTIPKLTKQGLEECIGVNHLGHFLLMHLLYSKLASGKFGGSSSSSGGRIVFTASSVHDPDTKGGQSGGIGATLGDMSGLGIDLRNRLLKNQQSSSSPSSSSSSLPAATMVDGAIEYNGAKVYKDSKLCNILTVQEATRRFSSSSSSSPNNNGNNNIDHCTVKTVAFNPGLVPTTGLFESLRKEQWIKAQLLTFVGMMTGFAVPVEIAGKRLVYMATAMDIPNGSYYSAPVKSLATTPDPDGSSSSSFFVPVPVSKEGSDPNQAKRLWEKSFEIIKDWL